MSELRLSVEHLERLPEYSPAEYSEAVRFLFKPELEPEETVAWEYDIEPKEELLTQEERKYYGIDVMSMWQDAMVEDIVTSAMTENKLTGPYPLQDEIKSDDKKPRLFNPIIEADNDLSDTHAGDDNSPLIDPELDAEIEKDLEDIYISMDRFEQAAKLRIASKSDSNVVSMESAKKMRQKRLAECIKLMEEKNEIRRWEEAEKSARIEKIQRMGSRAAVAVVVGLVAMNGLWNTVFKHSDSNQAIAKEVAGETASQLASSPELTLGLDSNKTSLAFNFSVSEPKNDNIRLASTDIKEMANKEVENPVVKVDENNLDINQMRAAIQWSAAQYGLNSDVLERVAFKENNPKDKNFRLKLCNTWDSNAKKGTPSCGVLQFIEPTFIDMSKRALRANPEAWKILGVTNESQLKWLDPNHQYLTASFAIANGEESHWTTY